MESILLDWLNQIFEIDWQSMFYGLGQHYATVTWAFLLDLLVDYGVYLVSALGLFVLFAAGQFSLGHAGLVGITSYSTGILVVKFGVPFWLSLPLSGITGIAAGLIYYYLLGRRLALFYLAIATFAVSEALVTLWLSIDYLGGALGFHGIPLKSEWHSVAIVLCIIIFCLWRFEKSRFWPAFLAIRESPIVAGAMGVNVEGMKMLAWSIGGFITGIGGNLWAHRVTIISPIDFSLNLTFVLILGVLLGGMRTFWGTIAGGAFIYFMPWLTTTDEPRYTLMFYGLTIVILLIVRPGGLLPAGAPKARTVEDLQKISTKASTEIQKN
tara:strand:- start:1257 stop:2231 length:975 start_codon:yes stop_codon:yes gene_type:complete